MTRIKIDLKPERARLYREALTRIRDVEITTDHPDAQIVGELNAVNAAAGMPCLLDRPDAMRPEALQNALDKNRPCLPAHLWRFFPAVVEVREALAAGKLGLPGLLRIHQWLTDQSSVESNLYFQLDLALGMFDSLPDSTFALNRPDYRQLHLGFPGDGMALIDVAVGRPGSDAYFSLHLIGSDGAVYADDHRNQHLLLVDGGSRALLHPQEERLGLQNLLTAFIAGVRDPASWPLSLADSLNVHHVLEEVS